MKISMREKGEGQKLYEKLTSGSEFSLRKRSETLKDKEDEEKHPKNLNFFLYFFFYYSVFYFVFIYFWGARVLKRERKREKVRRKIREK